MKLNEEEHLKKVEEEKQKQKQKYLSNLEVMTQKMEEAL